MIRILFDSAKEHLAPKPYAPWIQRIIDIECGTQYLARLVPTNFLPPIRDTLQIEKDNAKGKSIIVGSSKYAKRVVYYPIVSRKYRKLNL